MTFILGLSREIRTVVAFDTYEFLEISNTPSRALAEKNENQFERKKVRKMYKISTSRVEQRHNKDKQHTK